MRNKILLDKIAHRYNLNGIELNEKVIATCNSLKPGMYRIHWRDNMVYRLEELKGIFRLIGEKAPIKRGTQEVDISCLREFAIRVPKSELNLKPMTIRNIPIDLNNKSEYDLLKSEILSEIKE